MKTKNSKRLCTTCGLLLTLKTKIAGRRAQSAVAKNDGSSVKLPTAASRLAEQYNPKFDNITDLWDYSQDWVLSHSRDTPTPG